MRFLAITLATAALTGMLFAEGDLVKSQEHGRVKDDMGRTPLAMVEATRGGRGGSRASEIAALLKSGAQ